MSSCLYISMGQRTDIKYSVRKSSGAVTCIYIPFFMSVLLCFIGHILLSENTFFNNIIGCIVNCIFKGFMWKIIRCKYSVRKSSTRFYYLLCSILSGLLLYAYNYQNTKEVFQGSHLNLMKILFQ